MSKHKDAEPEATPHAEPTSDPGPMIRIEKGTPTDIELGALVTVLTAAVASSSADPASGLPADGWGAPVTMHRTTVPASPYGYRMVRRTRG